MRAQTRGPFGGLAFKPDQPAEYHRRKGPGHNDRQGQAGGEGEFVQQILPHQRVFCAQDGCGRGGQGAELGMGAIRYLES